MSTNGTQRQSRPSKRRDYTPLFNEFPPPLLEVQREKDLSDADIIAIFVKPWLTELAQKPIRFTSDPTKAHPKSLPGLQWAILRDEHNMVFNPQTGRATKNRRGFFSLFKK